MGFGLAVASLDGGFEIILGRVGKPKGFCLGTELVD